MRHYEHVTQNKNSDHPPLDNFLVTWQVETQGKRREVGKVSINKPILINQLQYGQNIVPVFYVDLK